MLDSEITTERNKTRLDTTRAKLARILLQKETELAKLVQSRTPASGTRAVRKAVAKGGLLLKGNNSRNVSPFTCFHGLTMTTFNPHLQIQRQEDDIRARVQVFSQAYHKSVQETQALRQEYFNLRLPQILRVRASKPPGVATSLISILF